MTDEQFTKAYNDFDKKKRLKQKEKEKGKGESILKIAQFKKSGGVGENMIALSKMAYYLVSKGHNTELFNPFKYPLNKLTNTYKIVVMNDLQDKEEQMIAVIHAIGSSFGNEDAVKIFNNQIKSIQENI